MSKRTDSDRASSRRKHSGVLQVFYPMSGIFAAGQALQKVYRTIAEDGTTAHGTDELMPFESFRQVTRYDEKMALEEKYSHGQQGDKLLVRVPGKSRPGASSANGAR